MKIRDITSYMLVSVTETKIVENLADEELDHEAVILDREEQRYRRAILTNALASLKPRERDILRSRRLEEPIQTLESLSKRYNVSKERIRQIESIAFDKLRKAVALEEQRQATPRLAAPSRAVERASIRQG